MNTKIMNTNILTKVALVACLVVAVTFSVMKFSKADTSNCNAQTALTGTIVSTGEFGGGALAIVINNSECSFSVSFDANLTSNNSRYDSVATAIGPWQSIELHINVPDCQYRLDLKSDSTVLATRTVRNNVCAAPTPTPTPTPSPTHTPIPTPSPTPNPSPTPIPTPGVFHCVPNQQSVSVNQAVSFRVMELGIGEEVWSAPGGNPSTGTGLTFVTSYSTPGEKQVTVAATYHSATCSVTVNVLPTPTPTPTPNPVLYPILNISKMVRNVSSNTGEVKSVNANANDTVEFIIRVSTLNDQTANNVRVTDSLPYGLNYISGSTTIDNTYASDGLTSGGINLGTFYSSRMVTLRFRATVGQGYNYNQYNYGSTTFTNSVSARADNTSTVTDSASVIVMPIIVNQNTLTITKTGRNISRGDTVQQTSLTARAGNGIEFTITVIAPYNTNLNNVIVTDLLPAGMTYTVRSTTLNNVVTTDGIVSGGLNIGSLNAGQQAVIKFYATVNSNVSVNQQLVNTATARADNVSLITSNPVYITIGNNVILKGALKVRTGPATDVFALASFGGLISSALYAGRSKFLGLIKLV